MAATKNKGRLERLYYNTGSHASPVWVWMKRAVNPTVGLSKGEINFQDQESEWEKTLGGGKKLEFGFTYREKVSAADTVFAALWDSFLNNTAIEFACMAGNIATSGVKGFRAFAEVLALDKTNEIEGMSEYSVTVKLTEHEEAGTVVEPDRYTVP